jgi:hypothetical protein
MQAVQQQFGLLKQDLNSIASKVGELEQEKEEHQLVVNTISPLSGGIPSFPPNRPNQTASVSD